jgi:hypothetical protein
VITKLLTRLRGQLPKYVLPLIHDSSFCGVVHLEESTNAPHEARGHLAFVQIAVY